LGSPGADRAVSAVTGESYCTDHVISTVIMAKESIDAIADDEER
jgi:hypothetical protein